MDSQNSIMKEYTSIAGFASAFDTHQSFIPVPEQVTEAIFTMPRKKSRCQYGRRSRQYYEYLEQRTEELVPFATEAERSALLSLRDFRRRLVQTYEGILIEENIS